MTSTTLENSGSFETYRDIRFSPANKAILQGQLAEMLRRAAYESPTEHGLRSVTQLLKNADVPTMRPLLPILFRLKDEPYTLDNHRQFGPLFRTLLPSKRILKTGRQTGKSQSLATSEVLTCGSIPNFTLLHVTPLFEHTRRYSSNYIRPLVETSPFRRLLRDKTAKSVLQRSFPNNSNLIFSFAFSQAGPMALSRLRGVPADEVAFDEAQDLDPTYIPIILEALSGSPWRLVVLAGTPKGLANPMETNWSTSSRGEWVIPCPACHYENVPAATHDLMKMIGKPDEFISESRPGTICARRTCGKRINPREGRWLHQNPHLLDKFAGYHIPQQILPQHFADKRAWRQLVNKREGAGGMTETQFLNEVCGESSDAGTSLVTLTDLKRAATLHKNVLEVASDPRILSRYAHRFVSADWGGGGETGRSLTVFSVLGMMGNGNIEVIYGYRSRTPYDHIGEARIGLDLMRRFKCSHFAHDFNGIGATRETFMVHAGVSLKRIFALAYHRRLIGSAIMRPHPPSEFTPRMYWLVDRSRALQLVATRIKQLGIRFFEYDHFGEEDPGLLHDFLTLHEHYIETKLADEIYTVIHDSRLSDDFAQSVTLGCCAMWQFTGQWPKLTLPGRELTAEEMALLHPDMQQDIYMPDDLSPDDMQV